jgi:hypothetical protein
MAGFDTTLQTTAKQDIINNASDRFITELTAEINANTSLTSQEKANIIASIEDNPPKDSNKFKIQIEEIVERIYADIQNQLLNKAVISIPNVIDNVTWNGVDVVVTRATKTGTISSFNP